MRKLNGFLVSAVFLVYAHPCFSDGEGYIEPRFLPHLTQSAQTNGRGEISFLPFPGASPKDHYSILNSLSIGLTDDFDIGTVPVYYLATNSEFKTWNITGKMNLWTGENWAFAGGLTAQKFTYNGDGTEAEIMGYSGDLSANYLISDTYAVGVTLVSSMVSLSYKPSEGKPLRMSAVQTPDLYLDFSYRVRPKLFWVTGLSVATPLFDLAGGAVSEKKVGLGGSLIWSAKYRFISRIGLGAHWIQETEAPFLVFSLGL